jgi:hypothetical protein
VGVKRSKEPPKIIWREEFRTVRILTPKLPGVIVPPIPSPVDVIGYNYFYFFVLLEYHLLTADLKRGRS